MKIHLNLRVLEKFIEIKNDLTVHKYYESYLNLRIPNQIF